jgi:hypothetical protein
MHKSKWNITASEFWTILGALVGLAALYLGFLAFCRQFGYESANIRFSGAHFSSREIQRSLEKPSVFGANFIGLNNLDDLIRLNPSVTIEILDNKPLDAIRIEVQQIDGFIDASHNPSEKDAKMTPWILEGVISRDYPITFRVNNGQKITIQIPDLLVRHMAQAQVKEPARRSQAHYGKFLVKAYAKLAGSPTWSDVSDNRAIHFIYFWYPVGFPDQECENFSKRFNQPLLQQD